LEGGSVRDDDPVDSIPFDLCDPGKGLGSENIFGVFLVGEEALEAIIVLK
jgi:hypothetical protein